MTIKYKCTEISINPIKTCTTINIQPGICHTIYLYGIIAITSINSIMASIAHFNLIISTSSINCVITTYCCYNIIACSGIDIIVSCNMRVADNIIAIAGNQLQTFKPGKLCSLQRNLCRWVVVPNDQIRHIRPVRIKCVRAFSSNISGTT